MTTRTLKPDRGKASRRTLRSRRQWQSEWDWSRQWPSEESLCALLDPTLHPPSQTPLAPLGGQSKLQQIPNKLRKGSSGSLPPTDHIDFIQLSVKKRSKHWTRPPEPETPLAPFKGQPKLQQKKDPELCSSKPSPNSQLCSQKVIFRYLYLCQHIILLNTYQQCAFLGTFYVWQTNICSSMQSGPQE